MLNFEEKNFASIEFKLEKKPTESSVHQMQLKIVSNQSTCFDVLVSKIVSSNYYTEQQIILIS
jgi:hypothetical protein